MKKILVKDEIKKGQLLVQLNDAEARSQAARAQAQVQSQKLISTWPSKRKPRGSPDPRIANHQGSPRYRERNLDALRRLREQGAGSPGEVKNAEDQLKRANADLNLLLQKQKLLLLQKKIEICIGSLELVFRIFHFAR